MIGLKIACWIAHLFNKDVMIFYHVPSKEVTGIWKEGRLEGYYETFRSDIELSEREPLRKITPEELDWYHNEGVGRRYDG